MNASGERPKRKHDTTKRFKLGRFWLPSMDETAAEHREADAACGREWVCMCASCRVVREQQGQG